MEIKKFVHEDTLKMSDDALRASGLQNIGILYGSNNYGCTLKHINELKVAIISEYPNKQDEEIEIWRINSNESIRHVNFTMLNVNIPTEDFIRLRNENQIYIL